MKEKCTIKKKIEIVQDILDELECIAASRRNVYWLSHIPTVSEDDLELFPDELKDLYLTTKAEMEGLGEGTAAAIVFIIVLFAFAGFGIYSCVKPLLE